MLLATLLLMGLAWAAIGVQMALGDDPALNADARAAELRVVELDLIATSENTARAVRVLAADGHRAELEARASRLAAQARAARARARSEAAKRAARRAADQAASDAAQATVVQPPPAVAPTPVVTHAS